MGCTELGETLKAKWLSMHFVTFQQVGSWRSHIRRTSFSFRGQFAKSTFRADGTCNANVRHAPNGAAILLLVMRGAGSCLQKAARWDCRHWKSVRQIRVCSIRFPRKTLVPWWNYLFW